MMQISYIVKQLLIVNILFFVATLFVPVATNYLALFYFETSAFKPWQPLTHLFMHGGWMHLVFNMFALYSFGTTLEYIWGGKKFLIFYILCGLGASVLHTLVSYYNFHQGLDVLQLNGFSKQQVIDVLENGMYVPSWLEFISKEQFVEMMQSYTVPVVGASGAIYGLLVAFAYMFPNAELSLMFLPIPVKAKYFVPVILGLDLYLGFSGKALFGTATGIAHFAHIGGALVGFLLMIFWKKNQFKANDWNS